MNAFWTRILGAGLATLLLGLPAVHALAQEVAEDEDPPGRVARLSYREGDVTLEAAGSSEPETALLNRPLTTGDRLWVDENSRAELQSGSATLHLDESTGIEFTEVGDDSLRVLLHDGALNVHVRDLGRDELIEIETPNSLVTLDEPGEYRIEADMEGNATVVKVRDGLSTVSGLERGSRDHTVGAGRQGVFTGSTPLSAEIGNVDPRTAFDRWSEDREQKSVRSPTTRYVSREVIGYEDLDDHGDWHSHPEYGYVWYPRTVVAGWAPYRYGQWVWVRPWGWTWVDSAPWGFAPFHYGRWVHVRDHWGWVPGPRRLRPVYAPALVAWVGGPSVSVAVSFGSGVGWFPLGPREVYVPGYRASRRHVRNVNVSNTVIVNNNYITNVYDNGGRNARYMHRDRPDGITAVSREDFTRGRPVDRSRVRWNGGDRGQIEANTLRPEGWRGNDERQGSGRGRRNDSPGATRERGNAAEPQRDLPGATASIPAPDPGPMNSARLRRQQPPVASDKRERSLPRAESSTGENRGVRLRTAPDSARSSEAAQPRGSSPQYGTERSQSDRRSGQQRENVINRGRTEQPQRERRTTTQAAPAPQRDFRQDNRESRSESRRERPSGTSDAGRGRGGFSPQRQPQGQKESSRGGRKAE